MYLHTLVFLNFKVVKNSLLGQCHRGCNVFNQNKKAKQEKKKKKKKEEKKREIKDDLPASSFNFFPDKSKRTKVTFNFTLLHVMLKNGQIYFKNIAVFTPQDF